ncbi:hypothetical protein D3C87_1302020 [compost metagenome]
MALALHAGQNRGDTVQHAADVHVDHPVPFVQLQRRQRGQGHHASVVHDDVHLPVDALGMLDEGVHVLGRGNVQRAIIRHAPLCPNILNQLFQPVGAARAGQHAVALGGQQPRRGFADAAAGAGNEHHFGVPGLHRHGNSPYLRAISRRRSA